MPVIVIQAPHQKCEPKPLIQYSVEELTVPKPMPMQMKPMTTDVTDKPKMTFDFLSVQLGGGAVTTCTELIVDTKLQE